MSANPHANGGKLLRDLRLPDFKSYAVAVPKPGTVEARQGLPGRRARARGARTS